MPADARSGLYLLCACTGLPFLAGAAVAWWLRGRVQVYGWLGALLPRFIRERLER